MTHPQAGGDPAAVPLRVPPIPEALRRNRWLMLLVGALLILGGTVSMVLPVLGSLAVAVIVGAALLVAGAFKLAHAVRCEGWRCRGWTIASGALCVVGGLLLLFDPLAGIISLTALMIAVIGTDGILRIGAGLRLRPQRGWGWMLAGGIAATGLALAMVAMPGTWLAMLGILAGLALLFEGWGFVGMALALRCEPKAGARVYG